MRDKTRLDDHFTPQDFAAITVGFKEVGQGKIAYMDPPYLGEALKGLWEPKLLSTKLSDDVWPRKEPRKWLAGMTDQFIKDIKDIDRKLQGRILQAITDIIKAPTDPKGDTVKPLSSDFKGLWRYRIGPFRLVYLPNHEKNQITLISFANHGEVYAK